MQSTPAPPSALDQLLPIITPADSISLWPLAFGWWLIIILFLLFLLGSFLIRKKIILYWQQRKLKQQTIKSLNLLFYEYQQQTHSTKMALNYLQKYNVILKCFCLSLASLPNQQGVHLTPASYSEQQWSNFISSHDDPIKNQTDNKIYTWLSHTIYQKNGHDENINIERIQSWSLQWVKAFSLKSKGQFA